MFSSVVSGTSLIVPGYTAVAVTSNAGTLAMAKEMAVVNGTSAALGEMAVASQQISNGGIGLENEVVHLSIWSN